MAGENHEKRNEAIVGIAMLVGGLIIGCLICGKVGKCNCGGGLGGSTLTMASFPTLEATSVSENAAGEVLAWDLQFVTSVINKTETPQPFEFRVEVSQGSTSASSTYQGAYAIINGQSVTITSIPPKSQQVSSSGTELGVLLTNYFVPGDEGLGGSPPGAPATPPYMVSVTMFASGVQQGSTYTWTVTGPAAQQIVGPVAS